MCVRRKDWPIWVVLSDELAISRPKVSLLQVTKMTRNDRWGEDDRERFTSPRIYVEFGFGFGNNRDRTVVWRDRIG